MPLSFHALSAGVFARMLANHEAIMAKAEAYATERKFNPDHYVHMRLAPDMHPYSFQIQSSTDRAKLFLGRVSGSTPPSWPDIEKTWEEVKARLKTGLDYARSVTAAQLDGQEDKLIALKVRGEDVQWPAQKYLIENALPNFYFHVTTAYDILRHAGVPLGKRDFTG
ncbi:MAG: DUF1993 domain-containing protein [Devosia sp.]